MNVEEFDQPTAELVRLAQRELHGDYALSDEAGFARLEARMAQPRRALVQKWWLGAALAVAFAAGVALVLLFQPRPGVLTFEVASGAVGDNDRIVATDGTRIRFSDGSEARLSTGTEARVQNLTEHGADVVLARGSMRVHIAKKPRAAWKVAAGPYDVRVTGTAFNVSWSKQTQTFDLRMETGAVIVPGPFARWHALKAGAHVGGVREAAHGDAASGWRPAAAAPARSAPWPSSRSSGRSLAAVGMASRLRPPVRTPRVVSCRGGRAQSEVTQTPSEQA